MLRLKLKTRWSVAQIVLSFLICRLWDLALFFLHLSQVKSPLDFDSNFISIASNSQEFDVLTFLLIWQSSAWQLLGDDV